VESRKCDLKVLAVAVKLRHDTHFMHLISINLKVSHYEKEGRLTSSACLEKHLFLTGDWEIFHNL